MGRSDFGCRTRRRVDIPIYSFEDHCRVEATNSIYSPHVLILEGIFALYDARVLELLDMKIFAEADADLCLARRSELKQVPFLLMFANAETKRSHPGCQRKRKGYRRMHQTVDFVCKAKLSALRRAAA